MGENLINRLSFCMLVVALAATAVIAGCGSGSSQTDQTNSASSQGSSSERQTNEKTVSSLVAEREADESIQGPVIVYPQLTKARYLGEANKVCESSLAQMSERVQQYGSATFATNSQDIYLTGMQFWFDDIHYLGAPKGQQHQVEGVLNALQQAVWQGQKQRVSSPKQMVALFSRFNDQADAYGLNGCIVRVQSFQS